MKNSVILTISSLLSILLVTFHLSDEIARGMEPGRLNMLVGVLIMAGWLYGTLTLAGRRSGYIIMLIVAIFGTGIPILHMSGPVGLIGGRVVADSSGAFFWAWQNMTMCTISVFSIILAVRCLWNPQWGQVKLFTPPSKTPSPTDD
jgi:hypothetical protein